MLKIGHTVDRRYEVQEVLGQGGMGCVYKVRHAHLDRPYALKELLNADRAAEDQFRQEAQILAGLAHPNLPRVSDYFSAKGQNYLVMDYVPGSDLQALLDARGKPFTVSDVLPWLIQLLDALVYLHAKGVVHRDLKPGNLKLTPEGRLVLVDFGIAKSGGVAATPGRTGFYAKQAYTPYLAAPEQVMGQVTGPRTDLYATGSTFAYLLTGQLPPSAALVPAPLGPLLARAMAPDPGGRWADALAMRQAVVDGQLAAATGPTALGPGGPASVCRDIRRPG
jgi:serine/threonine protein kinase